MLAAAVPEAHYIFVLCDAQACDLMDEAIRVQLYTAEGFFH